MLTVHHLASSQSERIVWLLEELGIPYEIVRYARDPVTFFAPADYKALSPFGTAPVITDGAFALGETGAIVDYVIAKYGNGRLALPPQDPAFADYLYWLHFSNGSFMPSAMLDVAFRMVGAEDTDASRRLRARSALALEISEKRLGEVPYFAGEVFTAADVLMVMPLKTGGDHEGRPNTKAYLQRMAERPAFQRAMAKAEPGGAA